MLDDQGEQLERVEGNLDQINTDMKEAGTNNFSRRFTYSNK
jgi:hypothetical protein